MPDSFVSSREKTQIEAIRLFRVYTSSKNTGDQREVSFFSSFFKCNYNAEHAELTLLIALISFVDNSCDSVKNGIVRFAVL